MRVLLLALLFFCCGGCSSLRSRYAMNDPIYASKYADGASKSNIAGKIKQALDARHTKYLEGWLVSGGAQVRPRSGQAFGTFEIGREVYDESYFSHRLSLSGFVGEGIGTVGVDIGARLQAPTRLAPFVGAGASAGVLFQDALSLALDSVDDSDLFQEDSSTDVDGLVVIYPEVGTHFWIDGQIRLTMYGRYLVTTEGRDFDDWLVGGQITLFSR